MHNRLKKELNMDNSLLRTITVLSAIGGLLQMPISAMAGGYDTGQRDWDFLFQQKDFAVEAATLYIAHNEGSMIFPVLMDPVLM